MTLSNHYTPTSQEEVQMLTHPKGTKIGDLDYVRSDGPPGHGKP